VAHHDRHDRRQRLVGVFGVVANPDAIHVCVDPQRHAAVALALMLVERIDEHPALPGMQLEEQIGVDLREVGTPMGYQKESEGQR
jgi:hypothetical protein